MPRPRWSWRVWTLLLVAALYVAAYAASARLALVLSPTQRFGVGIAAGALVLEDRGGSPAPTGRGSGPHSLIYGYRHTFRFNWWYRITPSTPATPGLPGIPIPRPPTQGYSSLKLPLWMPAAPVLLILAVIAFIRWRIRPGHCRGCGYDLRGTPGPVCPECGRPALVLQGPAGNSD
jgi:hypothetical protein